jgi:hypothetical protein
MFLWFEDRGWTVGCAVSKMMVWSDDAGVADLFMLLCLRYCCSVRVVLLPRCLGYRARGGELQAVVCEAWMLAWLWLHRHCRIVVKLTRLTARRGHEYNYELVD